MKKKYLILGIILLNLLTNITFGIEKESNITVISAPFIYINQNITKQVFYEDLDGDMTNDKIIVTVEENLDSHIAEVSIKINGKMIKLPQSWLGVRPIAYIVNINLEDNKKALAIGGDAGSSDYMTYFYGYEAQNLKELGITEGVLEEITLDKVYSMQIPGDGTISTYRRGYLLQTWYKDETYEMKELGKIILKSKELYVMNTSVKALLDIPLHIERNTTSSISHVLKKGETGKITFTDDRVWCFFEGDNGKRGWFKANDWNNIAGTGKRASEVFEGLFFAD